MKPVSDPHHHFGPVCAHFCPAWPRVTCPKAVSVLSPHLLPISCFSERRRARFHLQPGSASSQPKSPRCVALALLAVCLLFIFIFFKRTGQFGVYSPGFTQVRLLDRTALRLLPRRKGVKTRSRAPTGRVQRRAFNHGPLFGFKQRGFGDMAPGGPREAALCPERPLLSVVAGRGPARGRKWGGRLGNAAVLGGGRQVRGGRHGGLLGGPFWGFFGVSWGPWVLLEPFCDLLGSLGPFGGLLGPFSGPLGASGLLVGAF